MGNKLGKVFLMVTRPIRNINIEQRAHKVISKEKPIPAPQYESTLKQIQVAKKIDPEFMDRQNLKDKKLDKYLKDIYVTSKDPAVKPDLGNKSDPTKPLPISRKTFEYEDFNYYYGNNLKEGKCSLQQIQLFLTNHANDPQKYNSTSIAEEFKLDKKVVENLLTYNRIFKMASMKNPEERNKPFTFLE